MPLATPGQYAAMLDAAADDGYAYAAINATSSETLNAALRGFKLANADGIVQISVGGAAYMSGTTVKDALLGARAFVRYAHVAAEASPVLVALHTDHCPPQHVEDWLHPLLAESQRRVERGGTPLFHSHMFDGSTLPLNENLRIASALLARCSELDVILEVESGVVGGEEDGIVGPANGRDELYTTPSDLHVRQRARNLRPRQGGPAARDPASRPAGARSSVPRRPLPVCVPWQQRIQRA
jgi:fructose-bisphosphate aldolase, class II